MRPGRIVALVIGCIAALIGIGLLLGTLALTWAYSTQRDDDGYFSTGTVRIETATAALQSEQIDLGSDDRPNRWPFGEGDLATVRLEATAREGEEIFIGIADSTDVDAFVGDVAHDRVGDIDWGDDDVDYQRDGRQPRSLPPPTEQDFWVASAAGPGRADADLGCRRRRLVDRGDASGRRPRRERRRVDRGQDRRPDLGDRRARHRRPDRARVGGGADHLGDAQGRPNVRRRSSRTAEPVAVTSSRSPVSLNARLDEPLSRGLWLVKWFLAIPHWIILGFLWLGFFVTTIIACFAILFTARYPRAAVPVQRRRAALDVAGDVLRNVGIGTDRYPPFTLASVEYPATLEIEYPERLSRGLVLVKWWLLAIPHYIIVGFFVGGGWYAQGRQRRVEDGRRPRPDRLGVDLRRRRPALHREISKRTVQLRDGHEPLALPSDRLCGVDDRHLPTVHPRRRRV